MFMKAAASAKRWEAVTWKHLNRSYFHSVQFTSVGWRINSSQLIISTCGIIEDRHTDFDFLRWSVQTYIVNPENENVRSASLLSNSDKRRMINVTRAFAKNFGKGATNHHWEGPLLVLNKALSPDEEDMVEEFRLSIAQSGLYTIIDESAEFDQTAFFRDAEPIPEVEDVSVAVEKKDEWDF